jgi:hypothetical protein
MKKKSKEEPGIAPSLTTAGFIVLKAGQPCTLENVSGKRKGGVLRPLQAGQLTVMFLKWRDARRVITRTERCVAMLRGSLVEEWARKNAGFLFEPGEFVILPLGRQG